MVYIKFFYQHISSPNMCLYRQVLNIMISTNADQILSYPIHFLNVFSFFLQLIGNLPFCSISSDRILFFFFSSRRELRMSFSHMQKTKTKLNHKDSQVPRHKKLSYCSLTITYWQQSGWLGDLLLVLSCPLQVGLKM